MKWSDIFSITGLDDGLSSMRSVWPALSGVRRGTLRTWSDGSIQSRPVRLQNYSLGNNASVWLIIRHADDLAGELYLDPLVVLNLFDERNDQIIRLSGVAQVVEGRQSPVQLDPSIESPLLRIHADKIGFDLVHLEVKKASIVSTEGESAMQPAPLDVSRRFGGGGRGNGWVRSAAAM